MTTRTITAEWQGDYRVTVDTGPFRLPVDEPESAGGSDTGPQPTDLLLGSVASCFVLAMAWSARKHQVALGRLTVEVTGTYDGQRFREISLAVRSDLATDAVERVVASAERVCYVTNTLRTPPRIDVAHNGF